MSNIPTLSPNSDIPSIASLVTNLKGVEQQLHSVIEDKAPGPDQLNPLLLKMAATEIAPILTDIVGMQTYAVSSRKVIRVTQKTIDQFLCVTCKILEHIIHSHIMKHL